jgi:hypothetical protein
VAHEHRNRYAATAVAILAAGVLAEAARLVEPWPGFSSTASRVVSVCLMALWATTAVVVIRNRQRRATKGAWAIAVAASLAMFIHAAVTRVGGGWIGLGYMAAAVVLAFALKRSFLGRSRLIDTSQVTGS